MVKLGGHLMMRIIGGIPDIRGTCRREVNSGLVSASNPIWIQTGFGEAKKLRK